MNTRDNAPMNALAGYEIMQTLGPANYGTLYLARPPARVSTSGELVILKVLDTTTDDAIFRRVTRELRAFASTQSPQLVTLFEAGQEGSLLYYSMEYLPLGTLEEPAGDPSKSERVMAVADAARAAHQLHEAGLAHRDIRPGNVWLREGGGKLGDLGLAQVMAPGQTVTGVALPVSLEYLDPMVLTGSPASRASDVWALGLTLHRTLSGTGVFGDLPLRDPLVAFRKVLKTSPAVSESLEPSEREVVERCLLPPDDRYSTAQALADDLDALLVPA